MEESRSASLLDADYDLSVAREMQQLEIMMAAQEQERQRNQEPEPVVMEDPVWGKFTAPPAGFKPHQVTPFPLCCFRFAAGPERAAASPPDIVYIHVSVFRWPVLQRRPQSKVQNPVSHRLFRPVCAAVCVGRCVVMFRGHGTS
jgi:hypothetical protein